MPLLPKGQREQVLILVAIVAIGAAGGYWYLIFNKKAAALAEKSARLEQMMSSNEKARREMARGSVDQIRAKLAESRQALDVIRVLVPTTHEVPALLEQVSTAARREGLEIAGVDPQAVVSNEGYDTYRYDIGVVGGYHALAGFLANVGSLTRIVAPVNLRLTPPTNGTAAKAKARPGSAVVEARFQIQTYVTRRGAAAEDEAAVPISAPGAK